MTLTNSFLAALSSLLTQLPVLLVWLVGLMLAVVRYRQHPRASLLVIIALVIHFVRLLIGTWLNFWLPTMVAGGGAMVGSRFGMLMGGVQLVLSLVGAVAWGLIFAAVFGRRESAPSVSGV